MQLLKKAVINKAKGEADADFMSGPLSPLVTVLLLCAVFCVVVLAGFYVIRDLQRADIEAKKMYAESVIGLHRIGDLQYAAQETRRSTFYALSTTDSNLQVKYADDSRAADHLVTQGIRDYLNELHTPEELAVGRRLRQEWSAYLLVRDEVLASILEGSNKEAISLELGRGVELFELVRRDLAEIERLYDEQASQRLANLSASSRRTIFQMIGVLGFTLCFAIVSLWLIQRSRVVSALLLAKMQMDFVASVSHELRTPLAVISSAADNLADGVVSDSAGLKRYGGVIRGQCLQMADLVNQILLFAATKEQKHHLTLSRLQVPEVVSSVLQHTSEVAARSGFVIDVQTEENLPAVVADEPGLIRCLQNLIVNAIKYSGKSRWIGIQAFRGLALIDGEREVCISVVDRGIGISKSELPKIFAPFYRSPSAVAEQVHGTGLGLSLSKDLVEAMNASLTVKSEVGKGSVFTIHLPPAISAGSNDRDSMLRPNGQPKK